MAKPGAPIFSQPVYVDPDNGTPDPTNLGTITQPIVSLGIPSSTVLGPSGSSWSGNVWLVTTLNDADLPAKKDPGPKTDYIKRWEARLYAQGATLVLINQGLAGGYLRGAATFKMSPPPYVKTVSGSLFPTNYEQDIGSPLQLTVRHIDKDGHAGAWSPLRWVVADMQPWIYTDPSKNGAVSFDKQSQTPDVTVTLFTAQILRKVTLARIRLVIQTQRPDGSWRNLTDTWYQWTGGGRSGTVPGSSLNLPGTGQLDYGTQYRMSVQIENNWGTRSSVDGSSWIYWTPRQVDGPSHVVPTGLASGVPTASFVHKSRRPSFNIGHSANWDHYRWRWRDDISADGTELAGNLLFDGPSVAAAPSLAGSNYDLGNVQYPATGTTNNPVQLAWGSTPYFQVQVQLAGSDTWTDWSVPYPARIDALPAAPVITTKRSFGAWQLLDPSASFASESLSPVCSFRIDDTDGDWLRHRRIAVYDATGTTLIWQITRRGYAPGDIKQTVPIDSLAGIFDSPALDGQAWSYPSTTLFNPITGVAATDVITFPSAHGLAVGATVLFPALTGGAGLSTLTNYYVLTVPSATTITVSANHPSSNIASLNPTGQKVNFTTDITAGTALTYVALGWTPGINTHRLQYDNAAGMFAYGVDSLRLFVNAQALSTTVVDLGPDLYKSGSVRYTDVSGTGGFKVNVRIDTTPTNLSSFRIRFHCQGNDAQYREYEVATSATATGAFASTFKAWGSSTASAGVWDATQIHRISLVAITGAGGTLTTTIHVDSLTLTDGAGNPVMVAQTTYTVLAAGADDATEVVWGQSTTDLLKASTVPASTWSTAPNPADPTPTVPYTYIGAIAQATRELVIWRRRGLYDQLVNRPDRVLFWPMNETSGATATDQSGNARNGTISAGVALNQTGITGDTKGAFEMDTAGEKVSIADAAALRPASFAWWSLLRFGSLADTVYLIRKVDSGNGSWYLKTGATGATHRRMMLEFQTSAGVYQTLGMYPADGTDPALSQWFFVGFSFDNATKNTRFWIGRVGVDADVVQYNAAGAVTTSPVVANAAPFSSAPGNLEVGVTGAMTARYQMFEMVNRASDQVEMSALYAEVLNGTVDEPAYDDLEDDVEASGTLVTIQVPGATDGVPGPVSDDATYWPQLTITDLDGLVQVLT